MNVYGPLVAVGGTMGAFLWWRRLVARGIERSYAVLGIGLAGWTAMGGAIAFQALLARIPGALPFVPAGGVGGGRTIMGALTAGMVAVVLWARIRGESVGDWLDAAAGAAPLAQAVGRLGCFSAGCCYGKPTCSWLGMQLADTRGVILRRYPTQLMASAGNLLILAVVLLMERRFALRSRAAPRGLLFALYLGLYGLKRFVIEFFRATALPLVLGLTWAQLVAAVFMLVAVSAGLTARRSTQTRAPGARGEKGGALCLRGGTGGHCLSVRSRREEVGSGDGAGRAR